MKGYVITAPGKIEEKELNIKEKSLLDEENVLLDKQAKVKITKSMLTVNDYLRFKGELDKNNFAVGSFGVGVVTQSNSKLFTNLDAKLCRVYLEPDVSCKKCYNCSNEEFDRCSNVQTAGEDFDGFCRDFAIYDEDELFLLPDSVSDYDALFIQPISLALGIIDKLGIEKGSYVAIVGCDNFAVILAQLLIYHQAVPIILTDNEEDMKIAKNSGVYYVLGEDDNWQKEVSSLTGGRMTDSVIYISDSDIPVTKAFSLASFGADIAYTGSYLKNYNLSFSQAVKKQLNIHCISTDIGNTPSAINILVNKAIDLTNLKRDKVSYDDVKTAFTKMDKQFEKDGTVNETIVEML